jgi:hypothetical protein
VWGFRSREGRRRGLAFESGSYGNGQKAAIVVAVIVILVVGRQLMKPRRRAKP